MDVAGSPMPFGVDGRIGIENKRNSKGFGLLQQAATARARTVPPGGKGSSLDQRWTWACWLATTVEASCGNSKSGVLNKEI